MYVCVSNYSLVIVSSPFMLDVFCYGCCCHRCYIFRQHNSEFNHCSFPSHVFLLNKRRVIPIFYTNIPDLEKPLYHNGSYCLEVQCSKVSKLIPKRGRLI
uniref:Uncharacterized protein n=1 Tax=Corethron hystrix TaxID=216773 RepID=A0A7S1B3A9_9STRA